MDVSSKPRARDVVVGTPNSNEYEEKDRLFCSTAVCASLFWGTINSIVPAHLLSQDFHAQRPSNLDLTVVTGAFLSSPPPPV